MIAEKPLRFFYYFRGVLFGIIDKLKHIGHLLVECCSGLHLENVQSTIWAAVSTNLVDHLMSDNLQIVVVFGLRFPWATSTRQTHIGLGECWWEYMVRRVSILARFG